MLKEDECLGIDELEKTFLIYPNPSKDLIFVQGANNGTLKIQILDITGKSVRTQVLSEEHNTIDVSTLEPGEYICIIEVGDNHIFKKVIVE